MMRYGILLLNMGGPKTGADIRDFLYRLFSDRDIIEIPMFQNLMAKWISRFRAPKVKVHYDHIGGGSPILSWTEKQAKGLEEELSKEIECGVYIGMRYTKPFIGEAVVQIKEDVEKWGCEAGNFCLVSLPLYPHYSRTTTQSSYNELDRVLEGQGWHPEEVRINDWHNFKGYIEVLSSLIRAKLRDYPVEDRSGVHLLFSAHSLPLKVIKEGDPYEEQIQTTMRLVLEELDLENRSHLCYQSKVGPIKWLGPSTEETIKKIGEGEDILVIPISFVSDHYEVNYEIDIEYGELARGVGVRSFERIESLNANGEFIGALSRVVLDHIGK